MRGVRPSHQPNCSPPNHDDNDDDNYNDDDGDDDDEIIGNRFQRKIATGDEGNFSEQFISFLQEHFDNPTFNDETQIKWRV